MIEFSDYPLSVIFVGSVVVILAASEIGRQFGARATEGGGSNVATLQSATLGLLALMIGFTFAMALQRFDARRDGVLNEANAIGTTALRARLLPVPHNTESMKLLREYVQLRLDFALRLRSPQEQAAALARSNAIQEALWQEATAVAAKDPAMVPTGLFIQTLNEMIDDHENRLTAMRNRVPNIVLLALYATAVIASAFTGYASGLETRRSRVPMYVMGVLVAAVILLIQDLDRPGQGFVTVSQQPMIDTAASLAGYPE
jgi:hypothetical protein